MTATLPRHELSGADSGIDPGLRIRSAQLAQAYERLRASAVITIGAAALFYGLLSSLFPLDMLRAWLGSVIVVAVLRFALWRWHDRVRPAPSDMRQWEWMFFLTACAAALTWSIGAVTLLPVAEKWEVAIVLVPLFSVASVAATSLAMHLPSYISFLLLAVSPACFWLINAGGTPRLLGFAILMGLAALLFTGYMAWRANTRLLATELALSKALLDAAAAQSAAEQANRAKSRFLANMSHEIRTPLNGVLGMTELLGASTLTPKQQQHVQLLAQSAEHLLGIVNDVLDVARIEAGRLKLESQPFDIRELVAESIGMFAPTAGAKGLRLDYAIDPDVPVIAMGDALRLKQVLMNLLSNSVKFTERGSIHLRVSVEAVPAEKTSVRFAVIDTGCGIAPEALERIFAAFTQGDESSTRRIGGTGLGLAIARELTHLMNGRIGVESAVGTGSTFWFTAEFAAAESAPRAAASAAPVTTTLAPAGCKILVVEDNAINRTLIEAMLTQLRQDADFAHDGEQALERLAQHTYDLVFMDFQLPGIDGLEATRRIRAYGHRTRAGKHLPIVALTANAFETDRRNARVAGMDDFLAKPMRIAELATVLERWRPQADDAIDDAADERIRYDRAHESEEAESGARSGSVAGPDVAAAGGGRHG